MLILFVKNGRLRSSVFCCSTFQCAVVTPKSSAAQPALCETFAALSVLWSSLGASALSKLGPIPIGLA